MIPSIFVILLLLLCLLPPSVLAATSCPQNRVQQVALDELPQLRVLVPHILSYNNLVNCSEPSNVTGFCIDVFEKALSIGTSANSSWRIHYQCNPHIGITYDEMIQFGINESYDAIVGDVTIAARRVAIADFSQVYTEAGIAMLTQSISGQGSHSWDFFVQPFTRDMWFTCLGAFFLTGLVLWLLERANIVFDEDEREPLQRARRVCWLKNDRLCLR